MRDGGPVAHFDQDKIQSHLDSSSTQTFTLSSRVLSSLFLKASKAIPFVPVPLCLQTHPDLSPACVAEPAVSVPLLFRGPRHYTLSLSAVH